MALPSLVPSSPLSPPPLFPLLSFPLPGVVHFAPSLARAAPSAVDMLEQMTNEPNEDDAHYCDYCEMYLNGPDQWEVHIAGKKHRKNVQNWNRRDDPGANGDREDGGDHGGSQHNIRVGVTSQDPSPLIVPVCDAGGTQCGNLVLGPQVTWCEMAASWQSATGTTLLPPEGTRMFTVASELCDECLIAVVMTDDSGGDFQKVD